MSGTIKIIREGKNDAVKRLDEKSKRVIFKNCSPLTGYIKIRDKNNR